jgi:hypothetical protein
VNVQNSLKVAKTFRHPYLLHKTFNYFLNLEESEVKRASLQKPIPIQKSISCILSCYLGRSETCYCAPYMKS